MWIISQMMNRRVYTFCFIVCVCTCVHIYSLLSAWALSLSGFFFSLFCYPFFLSIFSCCIVIIVIAFQHSWTKSFGGMAYSYLLTFKHWFNSISMPFHSIPLKYIHINFRWLNATAAAAAPIALAAISDIDILF